MRNIVKKQNIWIILILTVIFILFSETAWSDVPKPGDIINSQNIDQYNQYFPSFMQGYVKNGWNLEKPVTIDVREHETK